MASSHRATMSRRAKGNTTKWLKNAMRSIGVSTNEALQEIYPNLYEVGSTGAKTSKNILNTLRSNRGNVGRVADTISSNKYVQFANKAYRNALSDLKSGNLNNQDRLMEAMMNGDGDSMQSNGSGFSFGDEDESNVNVNYINSGVSGDALLAMNDNMANHTEALIKTNKASMDAYIAVSSASMFQMQQIGSEVVGHLSNISNSLSALVDYQNQNMTKFIEASMGYYERAGLRMDQEDSMPNRRLSGADVFNNSRGGINTSQYKQYVKQQMKDVFANSPIGALAMIDDQMLEMAASNPLGFASKGIVQYMIPKLVGTTIQSAEEAFSSYLPKMLNEIADWSEEYGTGFLGRAKNLIGKTFGLRVENKTKLQGAQINKGAIPFDGETKHAITEIITKELREQTSYLQAIAEHYKIDTKKARSNGQVWDYNTNTYMRVGDSRKALLGEIRDSIVNTFNDGSFGKGLQGLINSQDKAKNKRSLQHSVDDLIIALSQSTRHVNPLDKSSDSEYQRILKSLSKNKNNRGNINTIDKYIQEMAVNNPAMFNDLSRSILASQQARNNMMENIENDPTSHNLWATGLNGREDLFDILNKEFSYGKYNKNKSAYRPTRAHVDRPEESTGIFGDMINSGKMRVGRQMNAIMNGNSKEAVNQFIGMIADQTSILINSLKTNFFTPMKTMMFGEKDENGYSKGGIFTGASNSMKDFVNSLKYNITGKEYTDSNGTKHDAKDDSVYSNLSKMGDTVKKGIMEKLFGKKIDENGNVVKGENKGLLSKFTDSFRAGLVGWQEAFLGKTLTEGDRKNLQKSIAKELNDSAPDALTGGVVGTGLGMFAGHSVLGMLVGGPIGGAAIGTALGFLKRSDKFQNWLFGEKDDKGERTGGLISKKAQDFLGKNKNYLAGGAALGALTGTITGGGILGTMVGGPIAGALTGFASSILLRSNTFHEFLFGSEKSGQKGILRAVSDAFMSHRKEMSNDIKLTDGGQLFGMSAIGAGTGALSAALIGKMGIIGASMTPLGPIGGALAGLGLTMAAQGKSFKTWLFGKDVEENGKKVHKQGIIGQFGNMLNATLFRPIVHEGAYLVKDLGLKVKHDVLMPLSFVAEGIADKAGAVFFSVTDKVVGVVNAVGESLKANLIGVMGKAFAPLGKVIVGGAELVTKTLESAALLPFNVAKIGLDIVHSKIAELTKPVRDLLKDVRKTIFKGLGKIFKYTMSGIGSVLKMATTPLRWVGGLLATGASSVADKVTGAMRARNINPINWGTTEGSASTRYRRAKYNKKVDRAQLEEEKKTWKIHDKNARLIAKYTNNQYSADTEEARDALHRTNPRAWEKLNQSIDAEDTARKKKDAEAARAEKIRSTDDIARSDPNNQTEEEKQTYFLQGIWNMLRGKKWDGSERKDGESVDPNTPSENKKDKDDKNGDNKDNTDGNATLDDGNGSGDWIDEAIKAGGVKGYLAATGKHIKELFTRSTIDNKINGIKNYWGNELAGGRAWFTGIGNRLSGNIKNVMDQHQENVEFRKKIKDSKRGGSGDGAGDDRVGNATPVYIMGMSGKAKSIFSSSKEKAASVGNAILGKNSFVIPKGKYTDAELSAAKEAFKSGMSKADILTKLNNGDFNTNKRFEDAKIDEQKSAVAKANLDKAKDLGTTAEEKKQEIADEEERKSRAKMEDNIQKQTELTEQHNNMWNSIFSKKGLITGGLILLSPMIIKIVKWLMDKLGGPLGDALGNFANGAGFALEDSVNNALWTSQNNARTNGETMMEAVDDEVTNDKNALDQLREGKILSAAKTFVTDKDGNMNHATAAKAKFLVSAPRIAARAIKNNSLYKTVSSVGKTAGKFLANHTKIGKNVAHVVNDFKNPFANYMTANADDAIKAAKNGATTIGQKIADSNIGTAVYTYADDAIKAGKSTVTKIATSASDNVAKFAQSHADDTIGTVIKYIQKFVSMVSEGVGKKLGTTIGSSATSGLLKSVVDIVKSKAQFVVSKVGAILGKAAALASTVIGYAAKEGTWILLGSVNGATGAARLFQVDSKYVDWKMRIISTIIGGFNGSTVGSIVDVVNEVVAGVTGVDFVSELACGIYIALSSKEKGDTLKEGREDFKNQYLEYQDKAISNNYAEAIKNGTIDASVTEEQYKAGVKNGTYNAKYDSFIDYNDKQHQTLGSRIVNGAKGAWNTVSGGVKSAWNAVSGGAKKVWNTVSKSVSGGIDSAKKFLFSRTEKVWYDSNGCYYKAKDNYYEMYNSNGDLISDNVDGDSVTDMIVAGALVEGELKEKSGLSKIVSNISDKAKGVFKDIATDASVLWDTTKKIGSTAIESIKKNSLIGTIKNIFKPSKTTAWFDPNGNYYKLENNGKYTYYNANNDIISENIEKSVVEEKIQAGLLTQGEIQTDSAAKKAITKIQESVKSAWDKAKQTVSDGWSKFTSWITGGSGNGSRLSNSNNYGSESITNGVSDFTIGGNGRGRKQIHGGRGNDTVNGFPYYSQSDPRWANDAYGNDGATMDNTGCGPTAMSMVASKLTGRNVSPTEMAGFAQATGSRDDTGTNWNFVDNASAAYGIPSTEQYNPSAEFISSQLDQGKPMILSGASGGGFGGSPYTPAGHYVVAVGKDNNGNVIINDPRGKGTSGKYNINDVANETGAAWSFGGGYGNRRVSSRVTGNKVFNKRGGFGAMNWLTCVKSVKSAIAAIHPKYSQSNYTNITINGTTVKVRNDCSGYVSACLIYYGAFPAGCMTSSYGFSKESGIASKLQAAGFKKRSFTGWNDLKEGDIVSQASSHVEIFSHLENGAPKVYTNGSTKSIASATPTDDGGTHKYDTVWEPPERLGGTAISTGVNGDTLSNSNSSSSSFGSSSSSSGGLSILSKLTGFFSEVASRAMNGLFTGTFNTDYSDYWSGQGSTGSNYNSGSSNSDTTSGVTTYAGGDDYIGKYVAQFESGSKGSSMISSGKGDKGGVSFGTYQFPSYKKSIADKDTNLYKFWNQFYASKYPNVSPGDNEAFKEAWRKEAAADPSGFAKNESAFILPTYYIPVRKHLMKNLSFDPDKHSRAAQDMAWSTSVQYGPQSSVLINALQGKNPSSMSATDLINTVQSYKASTVSKYYKSSSASVQQGVANRHNNGERQVLLSLANQAPIPESGTTSSTSNANVYNGGGHGNGLFGKKRKNTGGFGINYKSSISGTGTSAANQYNIASAARKYITTTNTSNEKDMLMNIIVILSEIANNTGLSSEKLDFLKNIKVGGNTIITNTGGNSSSNPILASGGNGSTSVNKNQLNSRNAQIAQQIALGV